MKVKKLILLIGDIIILYAALAGALLLRYKEFNAISFQNHASAFTLVFLFWIIIFYIHNLYDINIAKNNVVFYSALFRALLINIAFAALFFYIAPQVSSVTIAPKTNLLLTILIFVALSWLWRNLFNKIVGFTRLSINTAIIGHNPQSEELAKEIRKNPQLGYELKFILEAKADLENFKNILIQEKISTAIITPEIYKSLDHIQNLFECLRHKIDFINLSTFYEKFNQKIPLSAINQVWFLENISQGQRGLYEGSKRLFDIIMALGLLIISLPFWPILAAFIAIESRGPIFYKQIRIGQGGKPFSLTKFRTMIKDAEKDGPQMSQTNDPRITKFGKFLRKTRLDEIPQLWNVIKGEMSFTGPRAERPEFHEELKKHIPFYQERYLIKPGLSGWAQINHGYSSSIADNFEKIQYDLYYIKNRSFLFDLGIILKTINTILRGGGR